MKKKSKSASIKKANQTRAKNAAEVMEVYAKQVGMMDWKKSPGEFISDLLADLRHLADLHDLDFAEMDRQAYTHYSAELRGEQ